MRTLSCTPQPRANPRDAAACGSGTVPPPANWICTVTMPSAMPSAPLVKGISESTALTLPPEALSTALGAAGRAATAAVGLPASASLRGSCASLMMVGAALPGAALAALAATVARASPPGSTCCLRPAAGLACAAAAACFWSSLNSRSAAR